MVADCSGETLHSAHYEIQVGALVARTDCKMRTRGRYWNSCFAKQTCWWWGRWLWSRDSMGGPHQTLCCREQGCKYAIHTGIRDTASWIYSKNSMKSLYFSLYFFLLSSNMIEYMIDFIKTGQIHDFRHKFIKVWKTMNLGHQQIYQSMKNHEFRAPRNVSKLVLIWIYIYEFIKVLWIYTWIQKRIWIGEFTNE